MTQAILRALETTSGAPAETMDIARISPLAHAHVIPSGTYHFERATTSDDAARVS
jgi:hypothetical protein